MSTFNRIREEILEKSEMVEYVSFDVYDTLLFRMVKSPTKVFELTFECNAKLFPDYLVASDWREIRIVAEKEAKRLYNREVTLAEIYDNLPEFISNRNEIMENELVSEKTVTYVNQDIYNVILELYNRGKKIILISDMYLKKEQMKEILAASKIDINIFSQIFVSSEYGCKKKNKGLYEIVCKELGVATGSILHIGDNYDTDIRNAMQLGFKTVYYPLVSDSIYKYPFLNYEKRLLGDACEQIHNIRLLAAQNDYDKDDAFWFELGAMIFGPLTTYAANWVIDTALKNNIEYIYPLMREGKFLAETVKKAAEHKKWSGNIELFYISRKSCYPDIFEVITERDIEYILNTKGMTVEKIFSLLKIPFPDSEFVQYKDYTIEQTKGIILESGKKLYDKLSSFLLSAELIEKLNNSEMNGLLVKYMEQLGMNNHSYITYDIGWRGYMQNIMQRLANKHNFNSKRINLLLNCKRTSVLERNHYNGCDIRGFSAGFGRNMELVNNLNLPIFELFYMCEDGSTVGYEEKNHEVRPILGDNIIGREQMRIIKLVQEGMLSFQEKLYEVENAIGIELCVDSREMLQLIERLLHNPTAKEAKTIGSLYFDQNFGIDSKFQIIDSELLDIVKTSGPGELKRKKLYREDEWYYGLTTLKNPLEKFWEICYLDRMSMRYKLSCQIEKLVNADKRYVLVGAGKNYKHLFFLFELLGYEISAVIDNNKDIAGQQILGHYIKTFEELNYVGDTFLITSTYENNKIEMRNKLYELFGNEIEVICIEL